MLLVYRTHQGCRGWKDLVDEDEDGLLWCQLDPLANHIYELANGKILGRYKLETVVFRVQSHEQGTYGWHQVLLLVDRWDIRSISLLTDDLESTS